MSCGKGQPAFVIFRKLGIAAKVANKPTHTDVQGLLHTYKPLKSSQRLTTAIIGTVKSGKSELMYSILSKSVAETSYEIDFIKVQEYDIRRNYRRFYGIKLPEENSRDVLNEIQEFSGIHYLLNLLCLFNQ